LADGTVGVDFFGLGLRFITDIESGGEHAFRDADHWQVVTAAHARAKV
jgi:hypothetical protein